MSNAVTPRWHGDNYQARIFWGNALNLLNSTSGVVEVTFEADGPKAFDDVVVKYDPPTPSSISQERIHADYHQVKWHVGYGGSFGYKNFIEPDFIGATSFSLLQRLQQAKARIEENSYFSFVTIHRIADGDPLAKLISGVDKTLMINKLFDGTTDRSEMGKVRKLWRKHLSLSTDEELKAILKGFRVFENHRSLDELRSQINLQAQVVGLLTCSTNSDFRYDELARQLKVKKLNSLTKEIFRKFCEEESLIDVNFKSEPDSFLPIAIRSFLGIAQDMVGASAENTLLLTEHFNERYLKEGTGWQQNIRPKVSSFIKSCTKRSSHIRIFLDAHASIAFLAGSVLDLKSGVQVELVQKGRVGSRIWSSAPSTKNIIPLPSFVENTKPIGTGQEIALTINITHKVEAQATKYITQNLPNVGCIISFDLPSGPGQQSIVDGYHAAVLSEQLTKFVRGAKTEDPDAVVHIFAACPNAFLFYLGQQHQAIAPCIVYEFDFDRKGDKTYHPSFVID